MANPPARGVWVLTPVLHTAASKNAPSASAWGTHPTTKPHLKHLAANEKPLRSFTYRDCKTQPCGICKTATQFYIPLRRKMPTSASAWGIFLLAVAVGFEPTVGCPTQHFECCTFGRSDTLPNTELTDLQKFSGFVRQN